MLISCMRPLLHRSECVESIPCFLAHRGGLRRRLGGLLDRVTQDSEAWESVTEGDEGGLVDGE